MKHKMHLPTVEVVLAAALVIAVWLGVRATHLASAASLRQVGPTATATSTDTPTPTNTSTPTNTPASWRHERGGKL
jgi:hypothetical protein